MILFLYFMFQRNKAQNYLVITQFILQNKKFWLDGPTAHHLSKVDLWLKKKLGSAQRWKN